MFAITGTSGVGGCSGIITLADDPEIHPASFVTKKLYVPPSRPEMVVSVPDPVVSMTPGKRVRVQVPDEGKPDRATLPVVVEHDGGIIDPAWGAGGVDG